MKKSQLWSYRRRKAKNASKAKESQQTALLRKKQFAPSQTRKSQFDCSQMSPNCRHFAREKKFNSVSENTLTYEYSYTDSSWFVTNFEYMSKALQRRSWIIVYSQSQVHCAFGYTSVHLRATRLTVRFLFYYFQDSRWIRIFGISRSSEGKIDYLEFSNNIKSNYIKDPKKTATAPSCRRVAHFSKHLTQ